MMSAAHDQLGVKLDGRGTVVHSYIAAVILDLTVMVPLYVR